MARNREFVQVDVFGARPFKGNPVAVIFDGDGLSVAEMQDIARWTQLSETTFVVTPALDGAHYRLRIFTPASELPFAGHPTLGAAHAWAQHTGFDGESIVQECGAGLVEVRGVDGGYSFSAPPTIRSGPLSAADLAQHVAALRIDPDAVVAHQWVDNGPGFAAIELVSAAEVIALEPDFSTFPAARVGVIGAHPAGHRAAFEIRSFVPGLGVPEDPITGSLNAGVAQWFAREGKVSGEYRVTQGGNIGHDGELVIRIDGQSVWVGGATTSLIAGTILT
ncbi:MAG: PhzF family phenazine biosynthesis protein [Propionibacteriaceae bacterium]|nr:PhzF family phenazine biosynthesis protein [Propionibacteriaceae bacterium]